jgi:hypothetical protein
MNRLVVWLSIGVFWLLVDVCPGLAQPRVSVAEIEGKGGTTLRGAVVRALQAEPEVSLLSKDVVAGTAKRLGVKWPDGRTQISVALKISAWIEGSLEREGKKHVMELSVVEAGSGRTLGSMSYDASSSSALAKLVRKELWADLGELILSARAPSQITKESKPALAASAASAADEAAPAQDADTEGDADAEGEEDGAAALAEPAAAPDAAPDEATEEPAHEAAGPPLTAMVVGAGIAGFSRHLAYNDDLSDLAPYDLGLAPAMALHARWYPAVHFGERGVAGNIGLDLRAQFAFGLDTEAEQGVFLPTSATGFGIGVRGRWPLGDHELGAVVGYGTRTFSVDTVGTSSARALRYPGSTAYSYMRLGLEGRVDLGGDFALSAALAYLPTFSTGVELWFPNSSATGIEGELELGYALSSSFELDAKLAFQQFGLSFNPTIEDARAGELVAGGAVERYLAMSLGASWRFGS